jgi:hypothetical protein
LELAHAFAGHVDDVIVVVHVDMIAHVRDFNALGAELMHCGNCCSDGKKVQTG